jgi:hypothetical protein
MKRAQQEKDFIKLRKQFALLQQRYIELEHSYEYLKDQDQSALTHKRIAGKQRVDKSKSGKTF